MRGDGCHALNRVEYYREMVSGSKESGRLKVEARTDPGRGSAVEAPFLPASCRSARHNTHPAQCTQAPNIVEEFERALQTL